jgi:hypothetical protein
MAAQSEALQQTISFFNIAGGAHIAQRPQHTAQHVAHQPSFRGTRVMPSEAARTAVAAPYSDYTHF